MAGRRRRTRKDAGSISGRWLSRRRHLRCLGPRGVLAFDAAGGGAGRGAAAIHAEPRQRQDHVRDRRLLVLPCRSQRRSRQGRSPAARRRAGAEIAVRHILRAEYLARSEGRHRRLERGEFRHRAVEGHVAGRRKSVPGISLYLLPAHAAQRCARSLRLSENAAAGAGQIAPARSVVSVQPARTPRRLEIAVLPRRALRARSVEIGAMEPRRLSGERARPLRRVPFTAQRARRHHRQPALRRRAGAGRQRLGAEYHAARPARGRQGLVGKGHRELSRRRHDAGRRLCRRTDGRRDQQYVAARRRGPRRDGKLHRLAAADGRARPSRPRKKRKTSGVVPLLGADFPRDDKPAKPSTIACAVDCSPIRAQPGRRS